MDLKAPIKAEPSPEISAILVSFNTRELTLRAIQALTSNPGRRSMEIIVVDNASSDGTVDAIAMRFPTVRILRNEINLGFGAANNRGMSTAIGSSFLLINTDAFVHTGAVDALVDRMETDPTLAAVGPRLVNEDGSLQQSCFPFPSPASAWLENLSMTRFFGQHPVIGSYSAWNHDSQQTVDWVSGACVLVRREAFKSVGGFDERFFMYSEETDWQYRMRQKGFRIAFEPVAVVTHLGGASRESQAGVSIGRHFFESLDFYELKHHGWLGLVLVRSAMIIGCSIRFSVWSLLCLQPARRKLAASKARQHIQLVSRQLTYWPVRLLNARLNGRLA